ncbi:hypothetical protein FSP39_009749 [Pinctada imbricata]|uniref:Major facilitator superfamily (MFS) profile domain-containing protein n=1 Tax=Pinctada imbricata TaxID=66713 RepID=A0AA88YQT9_PINIB|nr:hypothetical protein FSP39_009749 [Pinctada imbricata]
MSVPVYVAEAAPSHIRGALVTLNQLFITIGILVSSLVAGAFSTDKENGWRYMLGLAGIPAVIQFFGFFFLPESPRWLVGKGSMDRARKALQKIRGLDNVEAELKEIESSLEEEREYSQYNICETLSKMLTTQPVRRALILGCTLQLFQQLCGINTVIYYSASILRMSGFPSEMAIWLACIPNAVNFLCTFIGIYAVEKAGRRILTLLSFVGIIIALIILGVGFYLAEQNSPPVSIVEVIDGNFTGMDCRSISTCNKCTLEDKCGFCWQDNNETKSGSCLWVDDKFKERYAMLPGNTTGDLRCSKADFDGPKSYHWANDYCPTDYGWMSVLGLALFVIAFAPGLGPNPWTINSEIYPLWARGTGTSLATAVNWLANLVVSMTFLTLLETITRYGTFFLFCGISFLGMCILFFILPETKDRTLEEVEELFMSESYKRKHKTPEKYGTSNGAYDKSGETPENSKL